MALYEMRTYTVQVGKLAEVVALYKDEGWPVLEKEGFGANWSAISSRTPAPSTGWCTSGSSMTMPLAALTGRGSSRARRSCASPERPARRC